jgi:hypothetical protein
VAEALKVVQGEQGSAGLLIAALELLAEKSAPIPEERLALLAQHHRKAVRDAAWKLAKELGRPRPKAFDPVKAMGSPAIRAFLKSIERELPFLPPPTAKVVELRVDWLDEGGKVRSTEARHGWLLAEKIDHIVVQVGATRGVIGTDRGGRATGNQTTCSFRTARVSEAIEATRRKPANWPRDKQAADMVLAWWLMRTGQPALAARVLFPLLDTRKEDEEFFRDLRGAALEECGQRMYAAYAHYRDYPEALRWAKRIVTRYPGDYYSPEAERLLSELPRRKEDFKELKLPAPVEWATIRKALTRKEQIDFLCRRLRLMSSAGLYGNGAGFFPFLELGREFAEPAGQGLPHVYHVGPSDNPPYFPRPQHIIQRLAGKGRTPVINPWKELKALRLTVADVPHLARHLKDNWLLVGISQIEPPHAAGLRLTTRRALIGLINDLARNDICRLPNCPELGVDRPPSPEKVAKRIDAVTRWARAHAGKGPADLEWYWARKERAKGKTWAAYLHFRVTALRELKDRRAERLLHELLLGPQHFAGERAGVLKEYAKVAPLKARSMAAHLLSSKEWEVQMRAAILCLPTAHAARARQILGERLRRGAMPDWSKELSAHHIPEVVAELLEDGGPDSLKAVARIFEGKALEEVEAGPDRAEMLRRLARAKFRQPYEFYLRLLRDKGELKHGPYTGRPVAEVIADEISRYFAPTDATVAEITAKHTRAAARIPHLEKWLKQRIAALEAKPPAKKARPPET